jgi:nucleotidyltransferase substrate binding protein (TIGR01987 family)
MLSFVKEMVRVTGKLDLSAFRDAVTSLKDAIGVVNDTAWFSVQTAEVQKTLLAGVIQNFEFVYELSVKMIRRQLEKSAASPTEVDFSDFRDVLRSAAEKGLIEDVEAWFRYRKMRNVTSHTYNDEKAQQVYEETTGFLEHAASLLKRLDDHNR